MYEQGLLGPHSFGQLVSWGPYRLADTPPLKSQKPWVMFLTLPLADPVSLGLGFLEDDRNNLC